jgi:NAD(P)-dependent dehydrogenase (short-subunit alcohol dehydrogenase family)
MDTNRLVGEVCSAFAHVARPIFVNLLARRRRMPILHETQPAGMVDMPSLMVTGANRGIGKALCEAGLARGWRVIAAMRSSDRGLFAADADLRLIDLDVTSDASVAAAARLVDEPIDLLINNAGVSGPKTNAVGTSDFAGFLATLDVNTVGPMRVATAFLPQVKRRAGGKIVAITSGMGELNANSDWTPYRVSKVALNKAMRALAADLQREGVAVAMLCPGWVRTAMGGPSASIAPEESAQGLLNVIDGLNLKNTGFYKNYAGRTLAFAS